jgi:hypothetical protein
LVMADVSQPPCRTSSELAIEKTCFKTEGGMLKAVLRQQCLFTANDEASEKARISLREMLVTAVFVEPGKWRSTYSTARIIRAPAFISYF